MKQVLVALDQLGNTLIGGWADETISARAWRLRNVSRLWRGLQRFIDALFFWQDSHCEASYLAERLRVHLPPEER